MPGSWLNFSFTGGFQKIWNACVTHRLAADSTRERCRNLILLSKSGWRKAPSGSATILDHMFYGGSLGNSHNMSFSQEPVQGDLSSWRLSGCFRHFGKDSIGICCLE